MLITSVDNKKIKLYSSLKNSKERNNNKLFLVEGMHLITEANKHNLLIEVIVLEGNDINININCSITYVTENVMRKLSNMDNCNYIGVCKIIDNKEIIGNRILMLDNIQDPGNLGTIIRSSSAFNIDTIVLSNDTVDLYNDKVIRSTQGMFFHMNIIRTDLFNIIPKLKEKGYVILGTNVNNGENVKKMHYNKYALIMGNEGHGLNIELQNMCDKNLYIKMNPNCESLNVGVATSILIYELNGDTYE